MQITLCFWLFKNSQLWTCFPALLQLEHVEEITSSLRILFSAVHDKFQTLDWTYTICFWALQLRHWLFHFLLKGIKKVFWTTPGIDHYFKCRPNSVYSTDNVSDAFRKVLREVKGCTWKAVLCTTFCHFSKVQK